MKVKIKQVVVLILIICFLITGVLTGCSLGGGETETESVTETETVISTYRTKLVELTADMRYGVKLSSEYMKTGTSLYSKIRNSFYTDKLIQMDILYINLLDDKNEKIEFGGSGQYKIKLSEEMLSAGGDKYEIHYYNASSETSTEMDIKLENGVASFSTDNIGIFVILNYNNSGKPIEKPTKTPETEPTVAPTVAPTATSSLEYSSEQTAAPVPETKPATEAATSAPATKEFDTVVPSKIEIETTPAPTTPPETTAAEIPTPSGDKKEFPSIIVIPPNTNNGDLTMLNVEVQNSGSKVLRVLGITGKVYGFSDTTRELCLTSSAGASQLYEDIPANGTGTVYFSAIGGTWYKLSTEILFYFSYDGVKYSCRVSYNTLSRPQIEKVK